MTGRGFHKLRQTKLPVKEQSLRGPAKSQHLVRKSKCGLGELEADHGQLGGSARFVLLGKLENLKSIDEYGVQSPSSPHFFAATSFCS
jgi:hypothetical protein